jgi:hypothetical protein
VSRDKPSFVPLWLSCSCGYWWDDWQPSGVPLETWTAHIRTIQCPVCSGGRVFKRTRPLSERPAADPPA